jgi:LysM repeat protein
MRKSTLHIPVLLVLSLTLAGCFRQAEEPFRTLPPAIETQPPVFQPTEDMGQSIPVSTNPPVVIATQDTAPATNPPLIMTVEATTNPLLLAPLSGSTSTPAPTATIDPNTDLMGSGGTGGMLSDLIIVTNTPTIGPSPTSDLLPTPTDAFFGSEGDESATGVNPECIYTVRAGETLLGIANRTGVRLSELRTANNITGDLIRVGQRLIIPGCDAPPITPTPTTPATPVPAGFESYTVQRGDTLFTIAQRYRTTVQAIVDANQLSNPNALQIGDVLLIPQN